MAKFLFGLIKTGKDCSDDDDDNDYRSDMNDVRSEAAKQKNCNRPKSIVKDRQ